jgi:ribosome-associated heat shock protein Hsp15
MENSVRIDKWLWAVRLFKTRSQATEACRAGKVRVDDVQIKPSREIKLHQEISIHAGPITRTVKVLGLIEKRVGAKLVAENMQDLTPEEEYKKLELIRSNPLANRKGRPTKKDRREMDEWFGWDE